MSTDTPRPERVTLTGDEIDTLVYESGRDADHGALVDAVERILAARREADAETIRGLQSTLAGLRRVQVETVERYQRLRVDVEEFAESLVEQGDEHVQGCMGQADCAACVRHDLRAILARHERLEGDA